MHTKTKTLGIAAVLLLALAWVVYAVTDPRETAVRQIAAQVATLRDQVLAIRSSTPTLPSGVRNDLNNAASNLATAQSNLLRAADRMPDLPDPPTNCVLGDYVLTSATAWSPSTCPVEGVQTRTETWTQQILQPATNGGTCNPLTETRIGSQPCTYVPPTPTAQLWGATIDPAILGTCSAAVHDAYVLDGGDGYQYRTWHPRQDPSGCTFAHEHGDNPASSAYPEIAARPVLFGYIGRRMPTAAEPNGHDEPHEGFKVFVSNRGDVNDEGRTNRLYSRSVFHMGTGGPKRFTTQHHSADIAVYHPEFGLKAYTRLMMNTGGTGAVCDPRTQAPVKDVINLQSPCQLFSMYEIWGTEGSVEYQGREVYRAFATPAVFDPITAFDQANPTRVLYVWDPALNPVFRYNDDRSYARGCDREGYAQPGYWYNGGSSRTTFYTDAHGNELASSDPLALTQFVSAHNSIGAPATNDGLNQFKMRRSFCGPGIGLKN